MTAAGGQTLLWLSRISRREDAGHFFAQRSPSVLKTPCDTQPGGLLAELGIIHILPVSFNWGKTPSCHRFHGGKGNCATSVGLRG